jgi:hypothetical protein
MSYSSVRRNHMTQLQLGTGKLKPGGKPSDLADHLNNRKDWDDIFRAVHVKIAPRARAYEKMRTKSLFGACRGIMR